MNVVQSPNLSNSFFAVLELKMLANSKESGTSGQNIMVLCEFCILCET